MVRPRRFDRGPIGVAHRGYRSGILNLVSAAAATWIRLLRPHAENGVPVGPCVLGYWHRDLFTAARLASRTFGSMALASHSPDAQYAVHALEGTKLQFVRGSTSQGAVRATLALRRALLAGARVWIALDGPRGPAGRASPGAAWLARSTGAPFVVLRVSDVPHLRLPDWSGMRLPIPLISYRSTFELP